MTSTFSGHSGDIPLSFDHATDSEWPVDRPRNWAALVNEALPAVQQEKIRLAIRRDRRLDEDRWVARIAAKLGMLHTLRGRGRPKTVARS